MCSETSISEALRYSLNRRAMRQRLRRLSAPPTPAEPPRYQPAMLQRSQQVLSSYLDEDEGHQNACSS